LPVSTPDYTPGTHLTDRIAHLIACFHPGLHTWHTPDRPDYTPDCVFPPRITHARGDEPVVAHDL